MFLFSRLFITLFVLVAGLGTIVSGQAGSVDPTFNAVPSNPLTGDTNFQQIIQPDGKVIVYNAPTMFVNGELRNGIFRLNADGSTDSTFAYNNEGGVGIHSVMIAPDGKIVLAGSTAPNHAKMIRLNPNGSIDGSFSVFVAASGSPELTYTYFVLNAIQADGKVISTQVNVGNIGGTWYSYTMARYNVDGTIDSGFVPPPLDGGRIVSTWALIKLLPDGRFYIGITSRSHLGGSMSITRRLADGTVDPTYKAFSTSFGGSTFLSIEDLSVAADGGLLATGVFEATGIGFPPRQQLRKFLPDGSATGFNAPLVFSGRRVHQLPDGKVLYAATGGTASRPLMRLAADGSVDSAYVLDPAITSIVNAWRVDPVNRPVFLAQTTAGLRFVRLLENGGIDPTFNPILGSVGTVSVAAVQPDDKVIVAGVFSHMNGTPRPGFARVNGDGSLDATFDPGTGFDSVPLHILLLPDGKILAMGTFSLYNGASVSKIIRLNANGSLDGSFTTSITGSGVVSAAIQPDGKIVIVGSFSMVNSASRNCIARIDSSGALDETFNPVLEPSTGAVVTTVVTEPSGKIAFGGRFATVNGISKPNLARVDWTGATDNTFNPGGVPDSNRMYRQADGKYVLLSGNGGNLSINRRNSDGSPDASFVGPLFSNPGGGGSHNLESVLLRPDGSMFVGGRFSLVGGSLRSNLVQLRSNGALDGSFLPVGTNAVVYSIAASGTGKVVIGGNFSSVENISRPGIARLNVPDFRTSTPFDFDGDGKADSYIYRASQTAWYGLNSSNSTVSAISFGAAGDIPTPADFDGDGKTDVAVFRPLGGQWWYRSSLNGGQQFSVQLGQGADIPLASDYDGDGKADFCIYRNGGWYILKSSNGQTSTDTFGNSTDKPVVGDFDGDLKADLAIFRSSNGQWWYKSSLNNGQYAVQFGANGDIPVPADYDFDGKTDIAIYRPSDGSWYILFSAANNYTGFTFGLNGDNPVVADYDGDGKADPSLWRPATGVWYLLRSQAGFTGYQFGANGDIPAENAFVR